MQRRDFLRNSGALGLAGAIGARDAIAQNAPAAATPPTAAPPAPAAPALALNGAPVVGHTTGDSSIVSWAVRGPSTAWIEFGTTPELGQRAEGRDDGLRPYDSGMQRVPIEGLQPGTRYFYRAHTRAIDFRNGYSIKPGETLVSEVGSFTTLNPNAESTEFIVWNDTHDNKETLTALHALSLQTPHDFLFFNGDVSNYVDNEEQMAGLYVNPYGLPFAQNAPLLFSRGNHDVRGRAARTLPRYVAVPGDRFYYSFRQGPMAALVLDTGEDKPDNHPVYGGLNNFEAYRTQQRRWLETEIEKPEFRTAPFRVLFCHIPLWWRDDNAGYISLDSRQKWHDLLVKANIQMVVSGHTHEALNLPPSTGRPYHQIIGGGPRLKEATLLHVKANRKTLSIATKDTTGKVLNEEELKA